MFRYLRATVLVTGGAVGLGKVIAESLADEGAKVIIADLKEKEGREVVKGIEKKGGEALFIKRDVSQEEEWKRVIEKTLDKFGRLDVLVNNAGVAVGGSVEETTIDEWRWLMRYQPRWVFLGTREAVLAMKGNENGGSIIKLSSIEGLVGVPNLAAYNSSKGGCGS